MRNRFLVFGGLGLGLLAGCSGSTGPAGTGRLTLQLAGSSAAAAATFAVGADVLTITGVQVVARKIRLERVEGGCPVENPESAGAQAARSDGEGTGEGNDEHDDCPDVRLDPMLLEPPIDAGATVEFSVDLPEGTYEEVKIQVHKPTSAGADAALLAEHPEFAGISVRVTGTHNGTDFTFVSAITAEIEIELETPVVVSADAPTAVTLAIDVGSWFVGSDGGLLSPIDPSQQVRSRIEQNIRRSFHAFEDHDRDGHSD